MIPLAAILLNLKLLLFETLCLVIPAVGIVRLLYFTSRGKNSFSLLWLQISILYIYLIL